MAALALALYGGLAWIGDLTPRLGLFLSVHALLIAIMALAWWRVRLGGKESLRLALGAALLFRIVMAVGQPALSDDVYRYVWDGRVQTHGIHPYRHAPTDPSLAELRDADWARINHPELETIYPPLSELFFLALAGIGAGVRGFKLAAGLVDFGLVLALAFLLRKLALPPDRVMLYAWNPLAVVETAGSGHNEPLGIVLVVVAAAWTIGGRPALGAVGLAGGAHAKLLPVVLVPGYLRRWTLAAVATFAVTATVLALPYALGGPPLGAGVLHYAARWRHNDFLFAGVLGAFEAIDLTPWLKEVIATLQQRWGSAALPWDWLYRHVWPPYLARGAVGALAVAWLLVVSSRKGVDPARESFAALGGVLLLAPTLHPWYVLWVLPFAAAFLSRGWLWLAAFVPLAYLGTDGGVPWWARAIEFVPALALMSWDATRSWRRRRDSMRR